MSSSDSRERMLRSAAELFNRNGYHATSWRQIVDHGHAPWGSINFHFPRGKVQLGAEAVALAGREHDALLRRVFFDPTDVSRSLVSFVQMGSARLRESDYQLGSPISTVALEMAHVSSPIRDACVGAFEMWRATLVELLTSQLDEPTAAELAGLFLSSYEGAMLRARTPRSTEPLDELIDLVPRLFTAAGT